MTEIETKLIHGDCRDVLKMLPDNSIDLIFTSPPYADSRANSYGGVKPDEYVKFNSSSKLTENHPLSTDN